MHDWTLLSAFVDWKQGTARLEFQWDGEPKVITALGLTDMRLPRKSPWGPSVSINRCVGPTKARDGSHSLVIEMQSGDNIELVAEQFEMPIG
jgi:hypothetical protein